MMIRIAIDSDIFFYSIVDSERLIPIEQKPCFISDDMTDQAGESAGEPGPPGEYLLIYKSLGPIRFPPALARKRQHPNAPASVALVNAAQAGRRRSAIF